MALLSFFAIPFLVGYLSKDEKKCFSNQILFVVLKVFIQTLMEKNQVEAIAKMSRLFHFS